MGFDTSSTTRRSTLGLLRGARLLMLPCYEKYRHTCIFRSYGKENFKNKFLKDADLIGMLHV